MRVIELEWTYRKRTKTMQFLTNATGLESLGNVARWLQTRRIPYQLRGME